MRNKFIKIVFLILSLALVVQVSLGASINRQKRTANSNNKNSFDLIKEFVTKLEPLTREVVQDIPSSNSYVDYKKEWNQFLNLYDDNCRPKPTCIDNFNIIATFFDLMQKYEENEANKEMTEVKRIFNSHGFQDLRKEYEAALESDEDP